MKTALFYFQDEPQYASHCSRAHAAHLLRCWRKSPRYQLTRDGRRRYRVVNLYPSDDAIGILETDKPETHIPYLNR